MKRREKLIVCLDSDHSRWEYPPCLFWCQNIIISKIENGLDFGLSSFSFKKAENQKKLNSGIFTILYVHRLLWLRTAAPVYFFLPCSMIFCRFKLSRLLKNLSQVPLTAKSGYNLTTPPITEYKHTNTYIIDGYLDG